MEGYARSITIVLLLGLPLAACGNGFSSRSRSTTISYYPAPVCFIFVDPCVVAGPSFIRGPQLQQPTSDRTRSTVPSAPTRPAYSTPTAAPPSANPPPLTEPQPTPKQSPSSSDRPPPLAVPPPAVEPPKLPSSSDRPPAVSESTSYFDTYAVAPRGAPRPAGDRLTAGFWNLTDHDLTVKVDGQPHVLARGKNLPVDVGRQFVWQVEGRDPQKEQIATGESAIEIVIRR